MAPLLKTDISILPPAILTQSPHLPGAVKLLNYAYDQSHISSGLLPPDPTTRLQSQTQLPSELEPDGFTILVFSSKLLQDAPVEGLITSKKDEATLIATASAKPYVLTQLNEEQLRTKTHLLFKRPPPNQSKPEAGTDRTGVEEWPKWEILAMAVHPALQGRGLASRLLEQVIAEIRSRASASLSGPSLTTHNWNDGDGANRAEAPDSKGKVARGKVMVMLSTMLEMNEAYYLKRGFVTTNVRRFEPGTMGSRHGFSAVEMMRLVDL